MNKSLTAAGFNEKTFTVGNVTLNYVVGPRNGPSLILIPAQTGTWESYKRVMRGLSKNFEVFIIEIRGHGKSTWTTGNYSWATIGNDVSEFLKQVVKRPAIISGNSSGGLIALWLAANVSEYVSGIVLEDVPLFSAEMPRFKYQDKFVYNGLKHLVESMHDGRE